MRPKACSPKTQEWRGLLSLSLSLVSRCPAPSLPPMASIEQMASPTGNKHGMTSTTTDAGLLSPGSKLASAGIFFANGKPPSPIKSHPHSMITGLTKAVPSKVGPQDGTWVRRAEQDEVFDVERRAMYSSLKHHHIARAQDQGNDKVAARAKEEARFQEKQKLLKQEARAEAARLKGIRQLELTAKQNEVRPRACGDGCGRTLSVHSTCARTYSHVHAHMHVQVQRVREKDVEVERAMIEETHKDMASEHMHACMYHRDMASEHMHACMYHKDMAGEPTCLLAYLPTCLLAYLPPLPTYLLQPLPPCPPPSNSPLHPPLLHPSRSCGRVSLPTPLLHPPSTLPSICSHVGGSLTYMLYVLTYSLTHTAMWERIYMHMLYVLTHSRSYVGAYLWRRRSRRPPPQPPGERIYMCMCAYVHAHVQHVRVRVHVCICMCMCMCASAWVYMATAPTQHSPTPTCMHRWTRSRCTCMHMHAHACTCMHMHAHGYAHACTDGPEVDVGKGERRGAAGEGECRGEEEAGARGTKPLR